MNILRNMGAVLVGLFPLVVGCAAPGSDLKEEVVGVAKQAEGGATTNGADPETNLACQAAIFGAMSVPLVTSETQLNPALDASLAPGEDCEQPLHEAYRCAGEADTSLPGPEGMFDGEELMTTATSWRDSSLGLSYTQKVDVFTCMTTLLNPNVGVPICLEGHNVSASGAGGCNTYIVDEAVWLTVPTSTAGIIHYVWPLIDEFTCQPSILAEILRQRVCGPEESVQDCGLVIRDDIATACTVDEDGYYVCNGLYAIKTKLLSGGYQSMYPGCSEPQ